MCKSLTYEKMLYIFIPFKTYFSLSLDLERFFFFFLSLRLLRFSVSESLAESSEVAAARFFFFLSFLTKIGKQNIR